MKAISAGIAANAMETVQRNDAMAKREAFEAGRIRDRLKKQSSVGQRASIAAVLRKAGVGTGGRTTPRDPAWAEAGYNAPPKPPKRRKDDRSPQEARDLRTAERDVERDWHDGESVPKLRAEEGS